MLPDRIELSTSPLPMECSTTELRQHARIGGIGPKGPHRRAVLATRTPLAQARGGARNAPKWAKNGASRPWRWRSGSLSPVSAPVGVANARIMAAYRAFAGTGDGTAGRRNALCFGDSGAGRSSAERRGSTAFSTGPHEGRSSQTRGKSRRGCEGFTTGSPQGRAARKSEAAKVAGARS